MLNFEGIDENLKFIVMETQTQVGAILDLLRMPSTSGYEKIVPRDDYIDNLKNIIESNCVAKLTAEKNLSKEDINEIRAIQIIGNNLERIADYCVNISRQMGYMDNPEFIHEFDYETVFPKISESISRSYTVLKDRNLAGALTICRVEYELDEWYKVSFDAIMERLKVGQNIQNLITVLFIFRYLERIGDALLNIGEALILAIIGEKIKIHQFQALQETLSRSGFEGTLDELDVHSILGSRSGCIINRLEQRRSNWSQAQESIFKECNLSKIRREKNNLELWAEKYPGLAPKILGYYEEGDKGALLVQFLAGRTLDEVILNAAEEHLHNAFFILKQVLEEVWLATRQDGPIDTDYLKQIRARLPQIHHVHENFSRPMNQGTIKVASSEELLSACAEIESRLLSPFAVLIHGDFNVNNVVYNHELQQIHFVDLYRSRYADYVQDVSVFLISNFRIPIFDEVLRSRLNWIIEKFYEFSSQLALSWQDRTFNARLALALARSFYTSTRYELNKEFAKEMYLRAHFLMEKVAGHHGTGRPWEEFSLPISVLYY
ncbi:MAG: phosphotransferase [Deltaproteobacteria bacterium]|nr:phosphotransferase [Deltaproteobacteria bacterium]